MVNYENGKIYKIVSGQTNNVYIGSTCKKYLSERFTKHNGSYREYLNGKRKHYMTSFDILKYDDAEIILVESFPCNSIDELRSREAYFIKNTPNCVNKVNPDPFIPVAERRHNYYEKNKEQIKERQKEYKNKHTDEILQRMKVYYLKNQERIKEKQVQKLMCECGKQYTYCNKLRHQKSKHHIKFLESQKIPEI
jgi:hypothetical protein